MRRWRAAESSGQHAAVDWRGRPPKAPTITASPAAHDGGKATRRGVLVLQPGDQPSLIMTFIVIDLFLLQMDKPLLSEQFSKTAEGIRALARSER